LYDYKSKKYVYSYSETWSLPNEAGEYILYASVTWSNPKDRDTDKPYSSESYRYYFKIVR
jgi:hypothetical protein